VVLPAAALALVVAPFAAVPPTCVPLAAAVVALAAALVALAAAVVALAAVVLAATVWAVLLGEDVEPATFLRALLFTEGFDNVGAASTLPSSSFSSSSAASFPEGAEGAVVCLELEGRLEFSTFASGYDFDSADTRPCATSSFGDIEGTAVCLDLEDDREGRPVLRTLTPSSSPSPPSSVSEFKGSASSSSPPSSGSDVEGIAVRRDLEGVLEGRLVLRTVASSSSSPSAVAGAVSLSSSAASASASPPSFPAASEPTPSAVARAGGMLHVASTASFSCREISSRLVARPGQRAKHDAHPSDANVTYRTGLRLGPSGIGSSATYRTGPCQGLRRCHSSFGTLTT
jgi:hypothetical protein